jgi:hypothetical protein
MKLGRNTIAVWFAKIPIYGTLYILCAVVYKATHIEPVSWAVALSIAFVCWMVANAFVNRIILGEKGIYNILFG